MPIQKLLSADSIQPVSYTHLDVYKRQYKLYSGWETHIELKTKTKIFCGCASEFGGNPNSRCCEICMGMPGTLPAVNKKVIEYAVMAGAALGCKINSISYMDRKHYFYPDLPKAYQITQYQKPICGEGKVALPSGKIIRIKRIHIEEDAGKLLNKNQEVFIDYNRAGVPLIEIVTEPDFNSAEEIREYIEFIRLLMKYLGISDCKMQEGSLRCDVNVSVMSDNGAMGTPTEIKNLNSVSYIMKAVKKEFSRQKELLSSGKIVSRVTLNYDDKKDMLYISRSKEDSADYRYFREPDLYKIELNDNEIKNILRLLPESPLIRYKRFISLGVSQEYAKNIISYKRISDFLDSLSHKTVCLQNAAVLIISCLFPILNENEREEFSFEAKTDFIKLLYMLDNNEISISMAKRLLSEALNKKISVEFLLKNMNSEAIDIDSLCKKVIKNNEQSVKEYLTGKEKALNFLIGCAMRESKGVFEAEKIKQKIINALYKY